MSKKNVILLGIIILKFVLQFVLISSAYELHRDEYLHLDQAHHLAWGYSSIPPLTSWVSTIIFLLGNSVFWVKFFPALFGALTILVVWKTIEELNGNLFALVLGATCVLLSVLLRINTLYQPNSFDILAWTTFYFVIIKYFKSGQSKWLYWAAVVFALGFLNKYNIVFLLIGILPAVLLTKERVVFTQKHLYFSMLFAFLLVFPNLWWQYTHDFPVFRHLQSLKETQLVNGSYMDFFGGQLLFFAGSIFVILSALYGLLFYAPFRKYKTFFWSILFTLGVFTFFKAKDYYAIGLYPVYIAFGAVFLEHTLRNGWKKYIRIALMIFPIWFFSLMFNLAFPNKSPQYILEHVESYQQLGLLRWEDGKDHALPQDFADMLGWKELAKVVDVALAAIPNNENTLIQCDNYGQAGAINFYSKQTSAKAYSMSADYINWYPLEEIEIEHVILVKENTDEDPRKGKEALLFEEITYIGAIENKNAREHGTKVYLLKGAKESINETLRKEIKARNQVEH